MTPKAYIHHQLPKRCRIHIPSQKGNDDFFAELRRKLGESDEIDGVEINPKTGSVVIHHQGDKEKIAQFIESNKLFSVEPKEEIVINPENLPSRRALKRLHTMNQKIIATSQGQMDISMLIIGGLIALAVSQAYHGKIFPPALALLSQAASVLRFAATMAEKEAINKKAPI